MTNAALLYLLVAKFYRENQGPQQWFGCPWSQISLKKLQTKHTSLAFPELPVCTPGFYRVAILLTGPWASHTLHTREAATQ